MSWPFLRNVILKALALFLAFNVIVYAWDPSEELGNLSLYNTILPGRQRFPFGEEPQKSYNLSLYDLNAMLSSHILSAGPKPAKEYRVLVLGDSSVWGTLLRPEETLAGQLNLQNLRLFNKDLRFYNLGYPTLSVMKDLMILDQVMSRQSYQPDAILWLITLESLFAQNQLDSPIVANNPERVDRLIKTYQLDLRETGMVRRSWTDLTFVGQRRAFADWFRLQIYGILWAATGIDQDYSIKYQPAQRDLAADSSYYGLEPPALLSAGHLSLDILAAGMRIASKYHASTIIVNEPIMISTGNNSHIRYNYYYPRWAYDEYRNLLQEYSQDVNWNYFDYWNIVPEGEFTNSAIHLTPVGEGILAKELLKVLPGVLKEP